MAEENDKDTDDKTEEASARKLEEARKKGQIARTPELPHSLSVITLYGPKACDSLARYLRSLIAETPRLTLILETGHGVSLAQSIILFVAPIMIVLMSGAMLLGVFGNLIQTGFLFLPEKLAPDMSRLNLAEGFKRLFGIDALANFAKTLIKLIITGVIAYMILMPTARDMMGLAQFMPATILPYSLKILIVLAFAVCAFLFVGSGLDYLWQRFRFMQRMKMSKQELKEEHRQSEGDPHIKAKQRQIRNERARKRVLANVKKATIIITNPTHYAVALAYDSKDHDAPVCVAKGMDHLALKIREEAKALDIPIIEDPPLARALYATVEMDEMIDPEHYRAVSKILSFVMLRKAKPY